MLPLLILFLIFFVICALLVFMILLQKGKGEGLAGLMGGVSAADGMGTPEAQKDLSRYTAWLSGIFFGMCLLITVFSSRCAGPAPTNIFGDDAALPPAPTPEEQAIIEDFASPELAASPELTAQAITPEAETLELLREAVRAEASPEAGMISPDMDIQLIDPEAEELEAIPVAPDTPPADEAPPSDEAAPSEDPDEATALPAEPLPPSEEDLEADAASAEPMLP